MCWNWYASMRPRRIRQGDRRRYGGFMPINPLASMRPRRIRQGDPDRGSYGGFAVCRFNEAPAYPPG